MMKMRKNIFRYVLAVFSVFIISLNSQGQGIDIENRRNGKLFFGFSLAPSISGIRNDFGISGIKPVQTQKTTLAGKIEAGFMFSDIIGVSGGIGYNSYSGDLSLDIYSAKVSATDSDNDIYQRNIEGKDISESQKIGYISIPLLFNFDIQLNGKTGIEIQPGINLNIPVTKKYSSEGIFDYTGYYSAYKITFEDIPYEDFNNDVQVNAEDNLVLKSFTPELTISGQFYVTAAPGIRLYAGAVFNKIISDISGYGSGINNYVISAKPSEMNSLMQGSSKVTAQAIGFRLCLRYYLK